ncbi:hypothetical protein BMF77_01182 [Dolichospermum sp. UHCC 0315A]|jgi:hypothetical protein|nr:hypothetical protein BMF77_01182 [Dolichospermum sp. UHCC 0315A]
MKRSVKLDSTLLYLICDVSSFIERLQLSLAWLAYEPVVTSPGSNEWISTINKEKL